MAKKENPNVKRVLDELYNESFCDEAFIRNRLQKDKEYQQECKRFDDVVDKLFQVAGDYKNLKSLVDELQEAAYSVGNATKRNIYQLGLADGLTMRKELGIEA